MAAVERQVGEVRELPDDGRVPHQRVHGFIPAKTPSLAEVLEILPHAHELARGGELRFEGVPWLEGGGGVAFAEEVEVKEAREELERAEDLVLANYAGAVLVL